MAQLIGGTFDATQFDPTQGVSQLPVGKHPVIIFASEVKSNNAGDGGYLQLNLRITDGPCSGQTGAYRLNLYSAKQQAVEIANKQFSALCHVLSVFKVDNSEQLHNIPFVIDVEPQKTDPSYTEVKRVYDINGNEPNRAGQGQQAAHPQAQAVVQAAQPQNTQAAWGANAQQNAQPEAQQQGQAQGGWGGQSQPQNQQAATGWGAQQQQTSQPAASGWGAQQGQAQGGAPANAPWGK